MAQLKDLIVNGASRLIGDVFTNKIQITAISAPTASNGTTYGPGTSGQILKSNGTNVYWAADNNAGGTVTSITLKAGTGISLDTDNTAITTSGTRTITNSGVRSATINGNYLRVNTNGTNADLTIPYATSAGSVAWGNVSGKPSTSISWGAGTTAGPTLTVTAAGSASSAVAIPSASLTASGIVTTGDQKFLGQKTFKYTSRVYPLLKAPSSRSLWYKITFPYNGTTSTSTRWFMLSFDLVIGNAYQNNAVGTIHVAYAFTKAANDGAYSVQQVYAHGNGIRINTIKLYYQLTAPGILYVNAPNYAYNNIFIKNLICDDTGLNIDWTNTTIETCDTITVADFTQVPMTTIGTNDGSTIQLWNNTKVNGNLEGEYIKGTWLYTSAATGKTTTSKIATIESDNFIYYITPANLKTTMSLNNVENKSSATIRGELTSSNVTTALGFTPYNATNPNGYTTNTGTVTKVTAGTGLSIGTTAQGNFTTTGTINHTNSVTAQTTQALYPIKIDACGHISAYGSAVTSLPASDVYAWAKASTKPSYTFSEIGSTPTTLSGYGITDAVTDVSWDSTNWKIQKTINGNTTDVITIPFTNGAGTWSAKMKGCTADGNSSFAAGQNSQATGIGSVALISGLASQSGAVAIGVTVSNKKTTASGIGSIAIGAAATASNTYTIALGYKTNASGTASIAIGAESAANANYSLAFGGRGTKASSQYQTTMGKWNIEDNQDTYAFILGNGTADDARSNALTVDWSGNLAIAGSLDWSSISNTPTTVAGYGITDVPTISIVRW